jgi:alkyl sulfatase BDS1-like metallo-beta-lactamase superfamily hydrolase
MPAVREKRVKSPKQARATKRQAVAQKAVEAAAAAEKVNLAPRAYFVLGETLPATAAVIEHEWGWARVDASPKSKAPPAWVDPAKNEVRFLADFDALVKEARKAEAPIAVYGGHRWYAVIPPHLLDRLVTAGQVVKLPDPTPDSPA